MVRTMDSRDCGGPTMHVKAFEEGLGRIMFVAGALEHERPFLGFLYKFLTLHPRSAVRRAPPYVAFILEFLSRSVMNDRHCDCNTSTSVSKVSPRVDAQASATRTGIGGWFPKVGPRGQIERWQSHWFSMEIQREDFPWVFERGNKPALLISTLEALAVLIALKLHNGAIHDVIAGPHVHGQQRQRICVEQTDEHQISLVGVINGAIIVSEKNARSRPWLNGHLESQIKKRTALRTETQPAANPTSS